MTLGGLLIDVVAAGLFLVVLWGCVFLILPVASIAANARKPALILAFFGLMAFDLYWVFNGFGLVQDLLTGQAFQADYWLPAWDFDLSLAAAGRSLWILVSWGAYLVILGLLGYVVLLTLGAVTESARGQRLFSLVVFAVTAFLGYLWVRGGRAWLMSFFL